VNIGDGREEGARAGDAGLRRPAGSAALPRFAEGWLAADGTRLPFLSYTAPEQPVNWSDDLETLHEESSRTHFIDVWTRRAMLARLPPLPPSPTVVDVGCSTGYLLEDLSKMAPHATLVGIDLIAAGLRKAHRNVPHARLLQADACALPLDDASIDGLVSANLLEHMPDDRRALAEIARVLRPGARAVLVVPFGPRNYDYYDRFLGHERRYARGELARKASDAGLRVLEDLCLGAPLYPAFWAVKQRNRRRHGHLHGDALERKVRADIQRTSDSAVGPLACRLEEALLGLGLRLPFGIRGLTVLARAGSGS
jgi:SAM-dependent methyltransferase